MSGRLFGRLPERGDIAVIKSPRDKTDYIKRVIGLPGDTVQMKDGQLWLNGAPVSKVAVADTVIPVSPNSDCVTPIDAQYRTTNAAGQPECRFPTYRETLPSGRSYLTMDLGLTPQDNTEPQLVPEGTIFLMGDNRDNSEDSRFDPLEGGLGMLPIENLVGRAELRQGLEGGDEVVVQVAAEVGRIVAVDGGAQTRRQQRRQVVLGHRLHHTQLQVRQRAHRQRHLRFH